MKRLINVEECKDIFDRLVEDIDYEGEFNSEDNKANVKCALTELQNYRNLEEQIGMPLTEFFSNIGKTRKYLVTVNNKSFYPATLLGGEIRQDGKFVYCVLVHDVDGKMPFHDYFENIYTQEEAERKLEELNNENT